MRQARARAHHETGFRPTEWPKVLEFLRSGCVDGWLLGSRVPINPCRWPLLARPAGPSTNRGEVGQGSPQGQVGAGEEAVMATTIPHQQARVDTAGKGLP